MKLCTACHRHLRACAGTCPFCGHSLPPTAVAQRLSAVILLGALHTACSSRPVDEPSGSTGGSTADPATTTDPTSTGGSTSTTGDGSTGDGSTSTSTGTSTSSTGGSTSTGEESTTFDSESEDAGGNFYGGGLGEPLMGDDCNPVAGDCPADEKCNPYASASGTGNGTLNAFKCVPVTGVGQAGDPCTAEAGGASGEDDCARGFYCGHVHADAGVCLTIK